MALEDLISRLERKKVTTVTLAENRVLPPQAAPRLAVTWVTPVTREKTYSHSDSATKSQPLAKCKPPVPGRLSGPIPPTMRQWDFQRGWWADEKPPVTTRKKTGF